MTSSRASITVTAALAMCLAAATVWAQGKSGQAPGKLNKPPRPGGEAGAPTVGTVSPSSAFLTTWLDDASTVSRGTTTVSVSFARWAVEGTRVWFAPSTFASIAATDRIGLGASVPVYHVRDSAGATARGISDIAFFGKIGVINPESHTVGLALVPVVTIYQDSTDGHRRTALSLPVSLEGRFPGGRVYGSAGYVTTGATFVSGALELHPAPAVAIIGTLGTVRATGTDAAALPRGRTDTSVGLAAFLSKSAAVMVSVGRTFSGNPSVDGGPWIAGGISLFLTRSASRLP